MQKNTSITLGQHFDAFIAEQLKNGRYSSISEVVRAGLRLLEESETRPTTLRKLLKEGQSANSRWLCDLRLLWQSLELWHVTNSSFPNRSARHEDVRSWQHRDFSIQTPCGNDEQICKLSAW
ncbi:type II toxin-antitoxin system ParD family antitoxin [Marinobacter vulgaris]|uniref:type II toxin-antitoxin system ParD family antitoxin n=1 Tax=Marinobacter vulgaris TaxID=1928331 RepID=UPI001FCAB222|nr:type II toxin-antitoxin system ParD family antitoxin [Marinobacter vulgaris]